MYLVSADYSICEVHSLISEVIFMTASVSGVQRTVDGLPYLLHGE